MIELWIADCWGRSRWPGVRMLTPDDTADDASQFEIQLGGY